MSFAILRTNVGLTTNIKIMVDSKYNLSLNSIESNSKLTENRFKNLKFNESSLYDDLIPLFYKDVPTEISYHINNIEKHDMIDDFSKQYDDLYCYGSRYITNNEYSEEFEYFAPIYIDSDSISKYFIIFRNDDNGIESVNSSNFKESVINRLKVINLFDLTKKSNLGRWLYNNFIDNPDFPNSPLDIDFKSFEFSNWNGINYTSGGYTSKSIYMDNIFSNEKEIFELDKFIFNNYKENNIVFPNIINLSFLFDDKPTDDNGYKEWSMNRYYGFYLEDLILSNTISSYDYPLLRDDVIILDNNILFSESNPDNPFIENWSDIKPFYVEFEGEWFIVERYSETIGDEIGSNNLSGFISEEFVSVVVNYYKIISNKDLSGKQSNLNKSFGFINDNILFSSVDNLYEIEDWDSADIWLIKINKIYHKLIKIGNQIKIFSDYKFNFDIDKYKYKIGSEEGIISIVSDFENPPIKFDIYKVNFSDIKDFDTRIIDTEYSKFEYELKDEITQTDESKMYMINTISKSDPKEFDEFIYKDSEVNIPVSSEYTANLETFKIKNNGEISDLWNINPLYSRWVFKNSLSANDYPYVLNNSSLFEEFNRTTNLIDTEPKRFERNLDYFYTINSSDQNYKHHSLHIEKYENNILLEDINFEYERYINIENDYFSYLFEGSCNFLNSTFRKNYRKYSKFNKSNKSLTNLTLFRGMEFRIFDVDSIVLNNNNQIKSENLLTTNSFNNWKFSIISTSEDNGMKWKIIEDWFMDKDYSTGSIVSFDDILYESIDSTITNSPSVLIDGEFVKSAPYNIDTWTYSSLDTVLWSPNKDYDKLNFVYNNGEWYQYIEQKYKVGFVELFTKQVQNLTTYELEIATKYDLIINNSVPFRIISFSSNLPFNINTVIKITQVSNLSTAFVFDEIIKPNNSKIKGVTVDNNLGFTIRAIELTGMFNSNQIINISGNLETDFWNPRKQKEDEAFLQSGYLKDNTVLFKGHYYKSLTDDNIYPPDYMIDKTPLREFSSGSNYWIKIKEPEYVKWKKIELWSPNKKYKDSIVIHNSIVWYTSSEVLTGVEPGSDNSWERLYSLLPDSEYVYQEDDNPLLFMNNRYYLIDDNPFSKKLDNGIIIYLNKKWKNILINIRIGDNTLPNLRNSNRDTIYKDIYSKLTAANISSAINDIQNKYEFSNYLKYIIIEENGNIQEYSFSDGIKEIPNIIKLVEPDIINIRSSALTKSFNLLNIPNINKKLRDNNIDDDSKIDWWNGMPLSFYIEENDDDINNIENTIYRYSGEYCPLFYDIDIFDKNWNNIKTGNFKFDTSLSNFGLAIERKSKSINLEGSLLKLRNSKEKSSYPMVGEIGIIYSDHFIFKSNWDINYHIETKK